MANRPVEEFPLLNVLLLIWMVGTIGGIVGFFIALTVGMKTSDTVLASGLCALLGMIAVYFARPWLRGSSEETSVED